MVEDRPIMSAKYRLTVIFGQNWPTKQSRGFFATAKLLVIKCRGGMGETSEWILRVHPLPNLLCTFDGAPLGRLREYVGWLNNSAADCSIYYNLLSWCTTILWLKL